VCIPGAELDGDVDALMRADPGEQQQPPEHDERPDLGLVLGRQRADPAVARQPAVHQRRHLGRVLEEAHRGPQVVQVPAEPAVVEVDHADRSVVHEQVGQPSVGVHQAVALRALAERPQPRAQRVVEAGQHVAFGRADAHAVLPAAPPGLVAERRRVVPVEPGEPLRPGPAAGVPVHPRGDLAELLEMAAGQPASRLGTGLSAGQELEAHAVPGPPDRVPAGAFGHPHHPPPVGGGQHPRGAHARLRAQRVHPGQLGGDLLLGVVAEPVHAQHGGPGVRVGHQERGVLRDVEQADRRLGVAAVGAQRLLCAARHPVHDVPARRQVVPAVHGKVGAAHDY
jgi:hypothetical protein